MIKKILLKIIKLYQTGVSPVFGHWCRFYPSCSKYCYFAIEKYGVKRGLWMGIKRICRCHPWNEGGVDEP